MTQLARALSKPRTIDAESRTVEAVISTGADVARRGRMPDGNGGFWTERLDIAGADLTRLIGAPVLLDHSQSSEDQVGVVEGARAGKDGIVAVLRFSQSELGQQIFADVADGVRRQVSVGYRISEWKPGPTQNDPDAPPIWIASRWQPLETSIVPIGADAGAQIRSLSGETTMTTTTTDQDDASEVQSRAATTKERKRCSEITKIVRAAKLGDDLSRTLIDDGVPLDKAREMVLAKLAEDSDAVGQRSHTTGTMDRDYGRNSVGNDLYGANPILRDIGSVIAHRLVGDRIKLEGHAAAMRGASIPDLIRMQLEATGQTRRFEPTGRMVTRALSGPGQSPSDFPFLLGDSVGRAILVAYEQQRSRLTELCSPDTVSDYRLQSRGRVGEFPQLEKKDDQAEYRHAPIYELTPETYILDDYGRMIGLSRRAVVNDDLGAFSALTLAAANACVALEADLIAAQINANPTMADSVAVFHATHKNLLTGGALSTDNLGKGFAAMKSQKGVNGETFVVAPPRFLVTPVATETLALQIVSEITPATVEDSNAPFRSLEVIADPRFDVVSASAWYLFTEPSRRMGLVLGKLSGEENPVVDHQQGWETDGIEYRVRFTRTAKWVDYRGAVRNPGP